jgi:hypothetical protein
MAGNRASGRQSIGIAAAQIRLVLLRVVALTVREAVVVVVVVGS